MRHSLASLVVLALLGCTKQPAPSTDATTGEDPCKGHVESGAPCSREGAVCRFNGRMSDIAPVSVPGEPPDCHCSSATWACPSVASLPPAR